MSGLDDWGDHLSEEMRAVWPMLAKVVGGLDGSLVGGTALAIHLRAAHPDPPVERSTHRMPVGPLASEGSGTGSSSPSKPDLSP